MNYNYKAIEKVYNQISKKPEQFDMTYFHRETECGTVACLAGWACILFDSEYYYDEWNPELATYFVNTAQKILRISDRETAIFDADNDENAVIAVLAELLRQKDLPLSQKESIEKIARKHDIWFDGVPLWA